MRTCQYLTETFGSKRVAVVDDVIWISGIITRKYPPK